jgi:predicted RecB family nuclease
MVATITNSIIDSFVICKQKGYLELVDSADVPTQYELQSETIATHLLVDFRQSVKQHIASDYDISRVEVNDFLDLSKPVFLLCPSFCFQNRYALTIDAVAINPPATHARKLTFTPITISPHHKIVKSDRISLCIKTLLLLERNPGLEATQGRIIYGSNRLVTTFSLQPYMRESRELLRQVRQLAENPQEPRYYKNNHCKVCKFESRCRARFVEKDDLSMLGSIPTKQIVGLNNHGIFTVTQLAYTFRPRRTRKNLKPDTRPQYPLKALALREKKTYVIDPPIFPSTPIEVFVDFEGMPDERFVYLAGIMVLQDGSERRESLWADSPGEADSLMQDFLERLVGLGNFTMYHYGNFEARALRAFNNRTKHVHADHVTAVMNNSFNILPLLSMNVYPPTYTNELKDIASFLGFHWSDDGMTGAKSILLRHNWELTGDPRHKDALVRYNIDDCVALK